MSIQSDDHCVICLEVSGSDENKPIYHLTCGHQFHVLCLYKWRLISQTCPLCRGVFEISSEIYRKCPVELLREIVDIQRQIERDLMEEVRSLTVEIENMRHLYMHFWPDDLN